VSRRMAPVSGSIRPARSISVALLAVTGRLK
jgi:hypothetical protein